MNCQSVLEKPYTYDYLYFRNVSLKLLNNHTSIKKILRFNNSSFKSKALTKANMHRLKLKKYLQM